MGFSGAKIAPCPPYTPLGTIESSKGLRPSRALLGFLTVCRVQMHPLLHPARCIVPCIIVRQISQLSPHVLIQSMRTSFCIYRLTNRQNTGYKYQIWAIGAGNKLLGVILSDGVFCSSALFSLLMTAFRGRNQRFIMECTLLWTIAG